jgi:hypothetical protein
VARMPCSTKRRAIVDVARAKYCPVGWRHHGIADLGAIAGSATPDPKQLANQVFSSLLQNDYGQCDGLTQALQSVLGPVGLEHLKQRITTLSARPIRKTRGKRA